MTEDGFLQKEPELIHTRRIPSRWYITQFLLLLVPTIWVADQWLFPAIADLSNRLLDQQNLPEADEDLIVATGVFYGLASWTFCWLVRIIKPLKLSYRTGLIARFSQGFLISVTFATFFALVFAGGPHLLNGFAYGFLATSLASLIGAIVQGGKEELRFVE